MAQSEGKDAAAHSHLFRVPEPLEKLLGEIGEIERLASPAVKGEAERIRTLLEEAMAAQARGDLAAAVSGIARTMEALAALAARVDPTEALDMKAVTQQFARALVRGDVGEATGAADQMRARAGAKIVRKD